MFEDNKPASPEFTRYPVYLPKADPSYDSCPTGVPRSQENAPPQDPTVGLCLGSWGESRKVGVFWWARYPCNRGRIRSREACTVSTVARVTVPSAIAVGLLQGPRVGRFLMSEVPLYGVDWWCGGGMLLSGGGGALVLWVVR